MSEQIDSSYGFVFVENFANRHFVDIYVPIEMLKQLQLVPGSAVLAKGLHRTASRFLLRPGKGGSNPLLGRHRFIASLRFPNRPNTLKTFLSAAVDKLLKFSSIRMQGLKSEVVADVMLEGGSATPIEDFDLGSGNLAEAAAEATGYVISAHSVALGNDQAGSVVSSTYSLDLPLLPHQYGKVRFNTHGGPEGRALKDLEGKLVLVRLALEMARSTITVDLQLSSKAVPYVLYFESVGLGVGAPIAETILSALPKDLNIDAVDAFEYLDYDPKVMGRGTEKHVARVEMLLVANTLNTQATEDSLKSAIDAQSWGIFSYEVEVFDVAKRLTLRIEDVPEDTDCHAFRKTLRNGRYAFVERLGAGAFGVVNKYLDLRTGAFVAGKHVELEHFNLAEVRALSKAAQVRQSRHLVAIQDSFYDGTMPVMVMEFVESTLADNTENRDFRGPAHRKRHNYPRTAAEAVEMAVQLLRGLELLHSTDVADVEPLVHADIKPENIGLVIAPEGATWKLIDFGLSRPIPTPGTDYRATKIAGTVPYMSPQVFRGRRLASNDIFSVGVVLYQVMNGWRFPGEFGRSALQEVEDHLQQPRNMPTTVSGFDRSRWNPDQAFGSNSDMALRDLVFKMMAFEEADRFSTASETIAALNEWLTAETELAIK